MDQLLKMKECLISCAQQQISNNMENVSAQELGEVIDMIKDISEAVYYCTITKAMEHNENYDQRNYPTMSGNQYHNYMGDRMDTNERHRMYYSDGGSNGSSYSSNSNFSGGNNARGGGTRGYEEMYYPISGDTGNYGSRDYREGRSGMSRRSYMESKQTHNTSMQMQELEKYMHELSNDVTDMIKDASPEEKAMLQQKLNILASKINGMK